MSKSTMSKLIFLSVICVLLVVIVFGDAILTRVDDQGYRFEAEHNTLGLRTMTLAREIDNFSVKVLVVPQDLDLHQLGIRDHVHLVWRWGLIPVLMAW